MRCQNCGKEFQEDWRKDQRGKLKNPIPKYCSRSCANHRIFTQKTNELKRQKSKEAWKNLSELKKEEKIRKYRETCRLKKENRQVLLDDGTRLDITYKDLSEYKKSHLVCEICGKGELKKDTNNLARDHQHGTNHFRGLLCSSCNYKLGWFERRKDKVLQYLEERNI